MKYSWPLSRIDELLDSLGKGRIHSIFDSISIFSKTPFTRVRYTSRGLYQWLQMTPGYARAPSSFIRVMQCVIASLDSIHTYLDYAIVFDRTLGRLKEHNVRKTCYRRQSYVSPPIRDTNMGLKIRPCIIFPDASELLVFLHSFVNQSEIWCG